MKRLLRALTLCCLALVGCVDPSTIGFHTTSAPSNTKTATSLRPQTVRADEVNDNNARAMARALQTEMEFDSRHEEPKPPR